MAYLSFICHSSKDIGLASRIVNQLEKAGIDCWIAPRNIPPGMTYAGSIISGIKNASFLIFVFTESSNQSDAVINEIEKASALKTPVIPFKVTDLSYSDSLEYYLRSKQAINAYETGIDKGIEELIRRINGGITPDIAPPGDEKKSPVLKYAFIGLAIIAVIYIIFRFAGASNINSTGNVQKSNPKKDEIVPDNTCETENLSFSSGNNTVFKADLSAVAKKNDTNGNAQPAQGWNYYEMEAFNNTWVGPPLYINLNTSLDNNFIYDMWFKVNEGWPTISCTLSDDGVNYSNYQFYLQTGDNNAVTYSCEEGWVKDNFYASVKKQFADRVAVPACFLVKIHWSDLNHISIKREKETIRFYLNNYLLQSFQASVFPIKKTIFALAQKSKVDITTIEATIPAN